MSANERESARMNDNVREKRERENERKRQIKNERE